MLTTTSYRIRVDRPARARAACTAPNPPIVDSGAQGDMASLPLPKPRHGWCRGRYTVTVFLQRGPYCPTPKDGQPPQPCPMFASQDLDVGQAGFTVRPSSPH